MPDNNPLAHELAGNAVIEGSQPKLNKSVIIINHAVIHAGGNLV